VDTRFFPESAVDELPGWRYYDRQFWIIQQLFAAGGRWKGDAMRVNHLDNRKMSRLRRTEA
jgi:hypothetical protein